MIKMTGRPLVAAALAVGALTTLPASAGIVRYYGALSGPAESPPIASPATGWARVNIDDVAMTMRVEAAFAGLLGTTTASHIHCCTALPDAGTAAVATATPSFPGFPLGVSSGFYDETFDMTLASSFRAGFITANGGTAASAFSALLAGMDSGRSYFNVHTTFAPGGEIRGFLKEVPEPASLALAALGLAALAGSRKARRR